MPIDVSKQPNPYNFATPVSDPALFAGRSREMEEIRYYLDQARIAPRPINMAVVGERASGKTSVLNMIAAEARKRDLCVVRVDLDEGDVATQLGFFYKLFDAVLLAACELGAYGGIDGKTYDTYRDMVDTYKIPDGREFCPFIFPMQYARAMNSGNADAPLSDPNFKRDMTSVQKELDRTVVVLLDECDVLSRSRVHLQKLRNIFMNTGGFMLVITGTPGLFPLIDDVFSPIIRQFKKLQIGPFEQRDETEACVNKPLESIGIRDPREIMSAETYRDVSEVHDVSGGRPYEIQLLCHTMFRRVQEGRARRMELDLDVLDDVRRELEASQDMSLRPVLNAVQRLTDDDLRALRELCSGQATFDQIWFGEHTFAVEERWNKPTLRARLEQFEKAGILKLDGGVIEFAGDDFDRIYCKYFARKKGIPLVISDRPYETLLRLRLRAYTRVKVDGLRQINFSTLDDADFSSVKRLARALADADQDEHIEFLPNGIADALYWSSIEFRNAAKFQLACVTLTSPWTSVTTWYRCLNLATTSEHPLEKLEPALVEPSQRATDLDGGITVEVHDILVAPPEQLSKILEQPGNQIMRRLYARRHAVEMARAHLQRHDFELAIVHGRLAYRYDSSQSIANNLGYVHMAGNDLAKARPLLEAAANASEELVSAHGLPQYNLGILYAKERNFQRARDQLELAIEMSESAGEGERHCDCLIVPKIAPNSRDLEFEEVTEPDLLKTARAALAVIKEIE